MSLSLPIVKSCDGCDCCCREQESPPGYALLLVQLDAGKTIDDWPHPEDVERIQSLPAELVDELRRHVTYVRGGFKRDGDACIWLDPLKRRCKNYEHRPQICRDFEVGSEPCIEWREQFKWGQ